MPVTETPDRLPARGSSCGAGLDRLLPRARAPPAAAGSAPRPGPRARPAGESPRSTEPGPGNFALARPQERGGPGAVRLTSSGETASPCMCVFVLFCLGSPREAVLIFGFCFPKKAGDLSQIPSVWTELIQRSRFFSESRRKPNKRPVFSAFCPIGCVGLLLGAQRGFFGKNLNI